MNEWIGERMMVGVAVCQNRTHDKVVILYKIVVAPFESIKDIHTFCPPHAYPAGFSRMRELKAFRLDLRRCVGIR